MIDHRLLKTAPALAALRTHPEHAQRPDVLRACLLEILVIVSRQQQRIAELESLSLGAEPADD